MRDLSIEYRPVASLLPSIRNSRTHSDAQRLLPALRGHMCADGCKFGIHESWQIMIECTFSLGRAWLNAREGALNHYLPRLMNTKLASVRAHMAAQRWQEALRIAMCAAIAYRRQQ